LILLDSTILVYAVGDRHVLCRPCRSLVELARDGDIRVTTTSEVIAEFTQIRARRSPRPTATDLAKAYATGLSPLVRPDAEDLVEGLELFADERSLSPFEAVLAATARRRDWSVASADPSFAKVPGLKYLDPASAEFLTWAIAFG
jgi:predicted nucleic acid-binding protein